MQPDNKHKTFSKEELFTLLDEKKSLPPEADDFDKEALEGLSMLKDRRKVNGLNNSIDEVLLKEKVKAKKRKNLYFLSAAASLILIVGLFFILKDDSFTKKESVLAENTRSVDNNVAKVDEPKASEESQSAEKKLADQTVNIPVTTTGEASGKENRNVLKEEKKVESEITVESNKALGAGDAAAVPPTEVAAKVQTKSENRKLTTEDADAENSEKSKAGKDYKTSLAKDDQWKREEAKKTDGIINDKEKEKDTRYLTNTVWTSTPASGAGGVADESKNKTNDYRSKSQDSKDGNSVAGNNANVSIQKNGEVPGYEKQSSKGPEKKSKSNKGGVAKPDTIVTDMLAGYSYYDKKPEKGIVQGGEPQRGQQATQQPVQTQNEAATSSTIAQNQVADVPAEQKTAQEVSGKKGAVHESQPDTKLAAAQKAEPQSPAKPNATLESPEFSGGTDALQQFIKKNLKISAPKKTGTIVAEFVVTKEGKIDTSTVKITTKIKDCDPCSNDVKELVKTMPKWKPATENGKAASRKQKISVQYNADAVK